MKLSLRVVCFLMGAVAFLNKVELFQALPRLFELYPPTA